MLRDAGCGLGFCMESLKTIHLLPQKKYKDPQIFLALSKNAAADALQEHFPNRPTQYFLKNANRLQNIHRDAPKKIALESKGKRRLPAVSPQRQTFQ